jgi:hypothetical protein
VKLTADTLECHVIGFTAGLLMPGSGSTSGGNSGGGMKDLSGSPWLDFSLSCDYKYKSNWLVMLDADLWFGWTSDNLQQRNERMPNVYLPSGIAYSWGGTDGYVTAYNRGISARIGGGKIIPVLKGNPNSGLLLKLSGGWFMQQTVFHQEFTESPVPQIVGSYGHLYDHLRNGAILTESLGFVFMSNYSTYVNIRLQFDISQCLSWSSRPYTIDNLMGLNGKDRNRYFDLLYGVKLTWMFPLMGKTTYDYYYY